VLALLCR